MYKPALLSAIPLLMLAEKVFGFGCATHSYTTCEDKIVHWFDPDDGMICDPLDCGGGRAPPKHGPGCDGYTGTETRGTSYLSCWKPSTTLVAAPADPTTVVTVSAEPSTSVVVVTRTRTYHAIESTAVDDIPTETEMPADPETVSTESESTNLPDDEVSTESETESPPDMPTDTSVVSKTGPTTAAPVIPSQSQSTETGTSTPIVAPNAARALEGSLIGVAGVAIGAMVFL
ncbi:hypothetical protein ACHAP5_007925 [Fusarium lateritium]